MEWKEILTILVPTLAFLAWIYNRLDKKFDKIDERFNKIDERFIKLDEKIDSVHMRLICLEGRFEERGHWESRIIRKTGTQE